MNFPGWMLKTPGSITQYWIDRPGMAMPPVVSRGICVLKIPSPKGGKGHFKARYLLMSVVYPAAGSSN